MKRVSMIPVVRTRERIICEGGESVSLLRLHLIARTHVVVGRNVGAVRSPGDVVKKVLGTIVELEFGLVVCQILRISFAPQLRPRSTYSSIPSKPDQTKEPSTLHE